MVDKKDEGQTKPLKEGATPRGSSKKKSWIIGAGGVLAIVVGVFLIYYFVIRGDETTEPATSKPNVWPCQQFNENNYVCQIPRNGKLVTNEEFVQGLAKANQSLIDDLNGIIRDFKFADGLFFESKPFDSKTLNEPYEFALVGTDSLNFEQDSSVFEKYMKSDDDYNGVNSFVKVFPSQLPEDKATLVSPRPRYNGINERPNYASLKPFITDGEQDEISNFWQTCGQQIEKWMKDNPKLKVYFSTAGEIDHYVHARIEKEGQFYQHYPYTIENTDTYQVSKTETINAASSRFNIYKTNSNTPLTIREFVKLLRTGNDNLIKVLTESVANYKNQNGRGQDPGLYFESRPFTSNTLDQPYEFIMVSDKSFRGMRQDNKSFREYWINDPEKYEGATPSTQVVLSLNKSTKMVIPFPKMNNQNQVVRKYYAHMQRFMINADQSETHSWWQTAGQTLDRWIADHQNQDIYFSTAGRGVHFLHGRIEPKGKYYRTAEYRKGTPQDDEKKFS